MNLFEKECNLNPLTAFHLIPSPLGESLSRNSGRLGEVKKIGEGFRL